MTEPDVLFAKHGRAGRITLNRPKAVNALSIAIIQSMHEQLCRWRNDDTVQLIVLHKVEGKAFCVGGRYSRDIRFRYR
ncbi:MAG: enoyl-CoA hydratase/isomerase family protein [Alphaproteobacteria bacterium]|nr:enoyl-CoA hydratase/isomerase family protein [Alphaproteobacteria bacterium]